MKNTLKKRKSTHTCSKWNVYVTCKERPSTESTRPVRTAVPGRGEVRLQPQKGGAREHTWALSSYTTATLDPAGTAAASTVYLASGPHWSRDPSRGDGAARGHRAGVPRTTAQDGPRYRALASTHPAHSSSL